MQGVAYVRFGLLDEDDKKIFLRGLENQTKVGRRVGVCWVGEAGEGGEEVGGGLTSHSLLCFLLCSSW